MISGAIERVKDILESTDLLNRVIFSDPDEFLAFKTNFFPAAHINVGVGNVNEYVMEASFSVIIADTVDEAELGFQEKETQLLRSLDETLIIASRLVTEMQALNEDSQFQMEEESANITRVYEQGTVDYYGWEVTFNVIIPNVAHNG